MDQIIELLKEINIAQIFVIFSGAWVFYKRLDSKIDKMDRKFENKFDKIDAKFNKIDEKFDKVNERIDRLSDRVDDIDRRLCRIEGSLQTHGHCLFNQRTEQKAQ